jgi:outer membrane protein assembly factor BamB
VRRGLPLALALALLCAAPAAASPDAGWTTFGNDVSRVGFVDAESPDPATLHEVFATHLDGGITAQILVASDTPTPGEITLYAGTAKGILYALNANGFERARRQLGYMHLDCQFLPDGDFGITGTPAIDARTRTLYVSDAKGFLHALDLVTLEEREGWPLRLYRDYRTRLTWGAITIVGRKLYVGTAELCVRRFAGKLFSVDLRTKQVDSWTPTPLRLGGGSGVWSWGGAAYDADSDSLLVATADAHEFGRNRGKNFVESAGYAEHVVRLDRNLRVVDAHTPIRPRTPRDYDFTGTPIVMRASGCPALVAAENKNGIVYTYRLRAIGKGPTGGIRLDGKLNGQPAWSPRTRSLYVVGHSKLFKLALTRTCALRLDWSIPLGTGTVNGPPVVVGDYVWFSVSDGLSVWAVDADRGETVTELSVGEPVFAQPTVLDGRVYVGGFLGLVKAFGALP